jgi:hypothetical protein
MHNCNLFNLTITVHTLSDRDVIIYFVFPNMFQSFYYHHDRNSKRLHSPAHETISHNHCESSCADHEMIETQ